LEPLAEPKPARAPPPGAGDLERFLPGSLAEVTRRIGGIHLDVGGLANLRAPDQGVCQSVRMSHIVKAESTLDAQAVPVGRAIPAFYRHDSASPDPVRELAAHAAIGTHAVNLIEVVCPSATVLVHQADFHEGPGGASLHTLPAGYTGALAHGIPLVEHDPGAVAAESHADHVIHLDFAAGADAERAVDTGVEEHAHGRVAGIGWGGLPRG
jgi:hypothetical protein